MIDHGTPINWSHPSNYRLRHWWMGLPGVHSGAKLRDLVAPVDSRNPRHGTLTNGPIWAAGKYGNFSSVQTDGTDDIVTATVRQVAAPLTILMRAKITSSPNNGIFLSHDSGANDGFRLAVETSLLRFTLGGIGNYTAVSLNPVNSAWSTIVVTWAGNSGAINGYHFNHETGAYTTGSDTAGSMSGTPSRVTISSDLFGSAFGSAMQVAELRFWDRIIPESEVKFLIRDAAWGYLETLNRVNRFRKYYAVPPAAGGATTLTVGTADATATIATVTITPSAVTLTPGTASATGTIVAPSVVLGADTLTVGVASATASIATVTITPSAVTLTPGTADATASIATVTITPSAVTITVGVADATGTVIPPSTGGTTLIEPGVAAATGSVVAPSLTFSAVTITINTAATTGTVVAPSVTLGAVTLTVGVASATATAIAPSTGATTIRRGGIQSPENATFGRTRPGISVAF